MKPAEAARHAFEAVREFEKKLDGESAYAFFLGLLMGELMGHVDERFYGGRQRKARDGGGT